MLSTLLMAAMMQTAGAPVVINEFSYDDSGTDDREFVELYNATKAAIDISGWKLDSADSNGPNTAYTIPANTKLAAGAFYVLGSAKVPNVTQVVGTTNLWENSDESLTLRDAKGTIIDTLIYEGNKIAASATWTKGLFETVPVWGNFASIDGLETSWSRLRDGMDTGNGRDFHLMRSTPGKSNNVTAVAKFDDNFDGGKVDDPHTGFYSTFSNCHYIDPTLAGKKNPNLIPASPQGGNALIFWDSSGGGNANFLPVAGIKDVVVECWVYLDATPEPIQGQHESWSIGVQGTTGTYYNSPDPSTKIGSNANGNTGISATYQVLDDGATLYLIDHGSGAGQIKILGQISIQAGKSDGWQRLRLEVAGDYASLRFGGNYGVADGLSLSGRISEPAEGSIYFGYREFVSNNAGARPLTVDHLTIRASKLGAEHFGKATNNSVGTPSIQIDPLPMIGARDFRILGNGMVSGGMAIYVLGTQRTSTSLGSAFPAGSTLYTTPVMLFGATTDLKGRCFMGFDIPNSSSLIGTKSVTQIFSHDPALKVQAPFGSTGGVEVVFGR